MKRCTWYGLVLLLTVTTAGAIEPLPVIIPEVTSGASRLITVDDLVALRRIDVLSVSPDRKHFAIWVRQADATANAYRTGWFVGRTQGGSLTALGWGGEARLAASYRDRIVGDAFEQPVVRWSADGRYLGYTSRHNDEVQLWRSSSDGTLQEQITHNAGDVLQFEWSKDGQSLYFSTTAPREQLRASVEAKARRGYHYDTELTGFSDLLLPRVDGSRDPEASVWIVSSQGGAERLVNESELTEYREIQARSGLGVRHAPAELTSAFAERGDGAQAWAARSQRTSLVSQVHAMLPGRSTPVQCAAEQCSGLINQMWWTDDDAVLFLRSEGAGAAVQSFYVWSPARGRVSTVLRTADDFLRQCQFAGKQRLLCIHENATRPIGVVALNIRSGSLEDVGDVNPELRAVMLGKVERFEWDTPKFAWHEPGGALEGAFAKRAFGFILYPPQFTATRKYPVFISPYSPTGFDNATNQEYALHALAARGFVVLSTQFPLIAADPRARFGADFLRLAHSAELGFPQNSMYLESTLTALDTIAARGFIDSDRVSIGGVSAGSITSQYMLLKYDRLAAAILSSAGWSQMEYYWATRKGRTLGAAAPWMPKPVGPGLEFWRQIDLAENVERIEAPILMNMSAAESHGVIRLINHMAEAGKPYDAYVFPGETHIKWQPAHLRTITQRNVDWLRFWLQSYEDPDPAKAEQYQRWRSLKQLREADRSRATSSGETSANVPLAKPQATAVK
jgi:dipeptidyl aminopeptidase/acylaminoacyl peptidase